MKRATAVVLFMVLGGVLYGSAQASSDPVITKQSLEERRQELVTARNKLLADLNAHDGAIQEIENWLKRLADAEAAKAEPKPEEKAEPKSRKVEIGKDEIKEEPPK